MNDVITKDNLTLEKLAEEYLKYRDKKERENSSYYNKRIEIIKKCIDSFVNYMDVELVKDVTRDMVYKWQEEIIKSILNYGQLDFYAATICYMYRFGIEQYGLEENPFKIAKFNRCIRNRYFAEKEKIED